MTKNSEKYEKIRGYFPLLDFCRKKQKNESASAKSSFRNVNFKENGGKTARHSKKTAPPSAEYKESRSKNLKKLPFFKTPARSGGRHSEKHAKTPYFPLKTETIRYSAASFNAETGIVGNSILFSSFIISNLFLFCRERPFRALTPAPGLLKFPLRPPSACAPGKTASL